MRRAEQLGVMRRSPTARVRAARSGHHRRSADISLSASPAAKPRTSAIPQELRLLAARRIPKSGHRTWRRGPPGSKPGRLRRWRSSLMTRKPGAGDGDNGAGLAARALRHQSISRDLEYVRHGTLSLLPGIDLLTGVVHASVKDRHRSHEFLASVKKLDAACPPGTAIKLILDNHSLHVSKETKTWLLTPMILLAQSRRPKLARFVLRLVRVVSNEN